MLPRRVLLIIKIFQASAGFHSDKSSGIYSGTQDLNKPGREKWWCPYEGNDRSGLQTPALIPALQCHLVSICGAGVYVFT